jgi:hypothetical protein
MDLQHSEAFNCLARLRESARRGDWKNAEALAASLPQHAVPLSPGELGEYLRLLKETLIVAKAWRAHASSSVVRLNAAAKFNSTGRDMAAGRHNFGV